jgi:TolB-like protein/Flp pilus assembly protein TadD
VLPIESLDGAESDNALIDGITEELIGTLGASTSRVNVIGRTSVMRYKRRHPSLEQVGRDLSADYVVEGTFRRADGKARLTVSLERVRDQVQVWTESFEQDAASFEAQERAAAGVAVAVLNRILPQPKATIRADRGVNSAAYQDYIDGRFLQHKSNLADLRRAIAKFETATKEDAGFAAAYSALAEGHSSLARAGASTAEEFSSARAAAEAALRINPSDAPAHNVLANVFFWRDWNWSAAEREFTQAIDLNPSLARAHHDYAFLLVATGRTESGLAALRRAIALDPLSPGVNIDAGWLLLQAHHFDEAIRQARRALELEPGMAEARSCIARAEVYQGHGDQESMRFLRDLAGKPESTEPFAYASACALLGRTDDALGALERADSVRSPMMPLLKSEPAFTRLHGDPRFEALVRKLGL